MINKITILAFVCCSMLIAFSTSCNNEGLSNHKYSEISFAKEEFEFGEIEMNYDYNYSFKFVNIGMEPVVISKVITSCGCAIPEWSKRPVSPGKEGFVNVSYNASVPGYFNKTIKVYFNGHNSPKSVIIKGHAKYPQ